MQTPSEAWTNHALVDALVDQTADGDSGGVKIVSPVEIAFSNSQMIPPLTTLALTLSHEE